MTVLKIIPLLVYGWFFARFCVKLLEPRWPGRWVACFFAAYELLVDHFVISRYFREFAFMSLLTHMGLILLILLLFRGGVVKKIAVGVIGYAVYNLSAYLVVIPMFLADGASEWVLSVIERSRFAAAILLLELIARKCTRFGGDLSRKSSAVLLCPVLFVIFTNEVVYFAYQRVHLTALVALSRGRGTLPAHFFLDALAVLLTAVWGLAVLLIAVFANNAMLESRLREQQLRLQVGHYRTLEQKSRSLAALRHDMKNHILSLKGLLSQGEWDQMARYLERMSESRAMAEPVIATGSGAVDAVLNEKYQQAVADGIDFQCDVRIPPSARVDAFDLCVILGNAADNAIEACRKCGAERARFVTLKSGAVKSFLVLEVKNSAVEFPSEPYGIGLGNIRAVAGRNGGTVDMAREGDAFVLSVLLPV